MSEDAAINFGRRHNAETMTARALEDQVSIGHATELIRGRLMCIARKHRISANVIVSERAFIARGCIRIDSIGVQ